MLLRFPRGTRLPSHLQVPPEVLAHWPKVRDVLQRGFELQGDFLRRGRDTLSARLLRSAACHAPSRPSRLKPGHPGLTPSTLSCSELATRSPSPPPTHPSLGYYRTGCPNGESPPLTPIAAGSTLSRCDSCFPARRKRPASPRSLSAGGRGVGR